MPSADDLFRPTAPEAEQQPASAPSNDRADGRVAEQPAAGEQGTERQPSGRVRHDEKMTVYVTADELLDLESARLTLRSRHGLAVDRGRLVRAAVALALADLAAEGEDSLLVQQLSE